MQIELFTDETGRDWVYGSGTFFSVESEMDTLICVACMDTGFPDVNEDGTLNVGDVDEWYNRQQDFDTLKIINKHFSTNFEYDADYGLTYLRPPEPPTMDNSFTVAYWYSDLEKITGLRTGQIISQEDVNRLINQRSVNIMIYNPPSTDDLQICWIDDKRFQQR